MIFENNGKIWYKKNHYIGYGVSKLRMQEIQEGSRSKEDRRKNKGFRGSIKKRFIMIFISCITIPFLIICVLYTVISKHALQVTSTTVNAELVNQIANNLNHSIASVQDGMINLGSRSLMNAGYLADLLSDDEQIRSTAKLKMVPVLSEFTLNKGLITGTDMILLEKEQVIGNISGYDENYLLDQVKSTQKRDFTWLPTKEITSHSVLVCKKFSDAERKNSFYLVTKFQLTPLKNYLDKLSLVEGSVIYLTTNDHEILITTSEEKEALPKEISNQLNEESDNKYFSMADDIIVYQNLENGWKLIVQIPYVGLTQELDRYFPIIISALIIILVIAIVVGYFYANSFSKPIINLMKLMKKAEKGDLTIQATIKGTDELAALGQSFNQMIENMNRLIYQTKEVIHQTIDSSEILKASAAHSEESIKELVAATNNIAQGTVTQALDAKKSDENMRELVETMDCVGNKASILLTNTARTQTMIQGANTTISSLTDTMNASLLITKQISNTISELNTFNQNIEKIMGLVENISKETNLLALNANIEAARVGEQGKGFAVVSDEVRKLSEQSKMSTIHVKETLTIINDKMKDAVQLANHSTQIIHNQEEVVGNTYHLFNEIIQSLASMIVELNDIDDSVGAMKGVKEIAATQIQNIVGISEETACSTKAVSSLVMKQQEITKQFATLATELSYNMDQLHESINAFKIRNKDND